MNRSLRILNTPRRKKTPALFFVLIFLGTTGFVLLFRSCACTPREEAEKTRVKEAAATEKMPVPLPELPKARVFPSVLEAVRDAPEKFPKNHKMPSRKETDVCGRIDLDDFSAARDLVYIDDPRVWWESDHDDNDRDTEDDHSMHAVMELPFRRLVNLAEKAEPELRLCVQECFRPSGIHAAKSLHCEGRALDLTFERRRGTRLSWDEKAKAYETLSKLCWQAGFDWVYYEYSKGTGPHIHASVRRTAPRLQPVPRGLPAPSQLPPGTVLPTVREDLPPKPVSPASKPATSRNVRRSSLRSSK